MFAKLKQKVQNDSSSSSSLSNLNQSVPSIGTESKQPTVDIQSHTNGSIRSRNSISSGLDREEILESKIRNLENQLEISENTNRNMLAKIDVLKSEIDRLNDEHNSLKSTCQSIQTECDTLRVQISEHGHEINLLVSKSTDLENDNNSMKNNNHKLLVKNAELSETIELLRLMNSKETNNDSILQPVTNHHIDENLVKTLTDDLHEKNKTIKNLQQRLNDLKKSLQRELKFQALPNEVLPDVKKSVQSPISSDNPIAELKTEQQHQQRPRPKLKSQSSESSFIGDEINFKYLKHVLLKFLTSREYEAVHLVKAISVLLQFNKEEENLVRETLEWKMSWFAPKPKFYTQ